MLPAFFLRNILLGARLYFPLLICNLKNKTVEKIHLNQPSPSITDAFNKLKKRGFFHFPWIAKMVPRIFRSHRFVS